MKNQSLLYLLFLGLFINLGTLQVFADEITLTPTHDTYRMGGDGTGVVHGAMD